jgi:signal peptidase I
MSGAGERRLQVRDGEGRQHWFAPHLIVRSLLELLVVGLFVATFVAQPLRIPSRSMEPTLRVGDFALADKQSFADEGWLRRLLPGTAVKRGELAVFHFPPDPARNLVKRIVALPGDRVRMRDGRLVLNGKAVAEPYAFYSPGQSVPFRDEFPSLRTADPDVEPAWWSTLRRSVHDDAVTVPPGCVFALGDNRNDSEDSRYWGFVPMDELMGRPLLVYLPAVVSAEPRASLVERLKRLGRGVRRLE